MKIGLVFLAGFAAGMVYMILATVRGRTRGRLPELPTFDMEEKVGQMDMVDLAYSDWIESELREAWGK